MKKILLIGILNFENFSWNLISIDNPVKINNINKGELIFRKIEDDEIELQVQKLNESA